MVAEVNAGQPEKPAGGGILREAGCFEQYFDARGRLGSNTYILVTARYESNVDAPLEKATLFAALEKAIGTNVALAARLLPSSSSPSSAPTWVRLPSVDLNRVVSFADEDRNSLEELLTKRVFAQRIDFTEDLPMWKLVVLRDGTIIFAYDHTLGDGQSGPAFHLALLKALNGLEEPPSEHSGIVTVTPQDQVLAPSMEQAIDVSAPFLKVAAGVAQAIIPALKPKNTYVWTGHPVLTAFTMDVTVRILNNISPEDATRLLSLSRQHKTTFTGTLHTLALIVLSRLIRAQPGGERYKSISTTIPISLRRYTSTPPTAFCNHVSAHPASHPVILTDGPISPDTFPWDTAAALVEAIRKEALHSVYRVGMLKFLFGEYDKYLLGQLGGKRAAGIELSNLGAFPSQTGSQDGAKWRIRETLFAQADATTGPALKINVVGTPEGGLGITVTWGKGAVDHELAEEFVRELEKGLTAFIAS